MSRPILIAINLFLSFIVGIVFLWPRYQDFKKTNLEIQEKKIELQNKKEYLSELEKVVRELENYKEVLAKIDFALPENPSLPRLFDFLQKTSSQSGLVMKNISFSLGSSAEKEVKDITIPLSLSGSYLALKSFLSTLEKSARLFEVKSLSLSLKEKSLFDFNLIIKTHSY